MNIFTEVLTRETNVGEIPFMECADLDQKIKECLDPLLARYEATDRIEPQWVIDEVLEFGDWLVSIVPGLDELNLPDNFNAIILRDYCAYVARERTREYEENCYEATPQEMPQAVNFVSGMFSLKRPLYACFIEGDGSAVTFSMPYTDLESENRDEAAIAKDYFAELIQILVAASQSDGSVLAIVVGKETPAVASICSYGGHLVPLDPEREMEILHLVATNPECLAEVAKIVPRCEEEQTARVLAASLIISMLTLSKRLDNQDVAAVNVPLVVPIELMDGRFAEEELSPATLLPAQPSDIYDTVIDCHPLASEYTAADISLAVSIVSAALDNLMGTKENTLMDKVENLILEEELNTDKREALLDTFDNLVQLSATLQGNRVARSVYTDMSDEQKTWIDAVMHRLSLVPLANTAVVSANCDIFDQGEFTLTAAQFASPEVDEHANDFALSLCTRAACTSENSMLISSIPEHGIPIVSGISWHNGTWANMGVDKVRALLNEQAISTHLGVLLPNMFSYYEIHLS